MFSITRMTEKTLYLGSRRHASLKVHCRVDESVPWVWMIQRGRCDALAAAVRHLINGNTLILHLQSSTQAETGRGPQNLGLNFNL